MGLLNMIAKMYGFGGLLNQNNSEGESSGWGDVTNALGTAGQVYLNQKVPLTRFLFSNDSQTTIPNEYGQNEIYNYVNEIPQTIDPYSGITQNYVTTGNPTQDYGFLQTPNSGLTQTSMGSGNSLIDNIMALRRGQGRNYFTQMLDDLVNEYILKVF